MFNKSIDMFRIRQLLRFYADGRGSKFISRATGISRNTIKKYLLRFIELSLTIEHIETMNDKQLAAPFLIVKPKTECRRVSDLETLLPALADKLKKRGVTKQMIYAGYISQCPSGYKHSAFLVRLNAYMSMRKASITVVIYYVFLKSINLYKVAMKVLLYYASTGFFLKKNIFSNSAVIM